MDYRSIWDCQRFCEFRFWTNLSGTIPNIESMYILNIRVLLKSFYLHLDTLDFTSPLPLGSNGVRWIAVASWSRRPPLSIEFIDWIELVGMGWVGMRIEYFLHYSVSFFIIISTVLFCWSWMIEWVFVYSAAKLYVLLRALPMNCSRYMLFIIIIIGTNNVTLLFIG